MNKLRITERDHLDLKEHLFPGDNKEAAAIILCGRNVTETGHTLLVQQIFKIPYELCTIREENFVSWPTDIMDKILVTAQEQNLAVLTLHCHPGGFSEFSEVDDDNDLELFPMVHAWLQDNEPHSSSVMLPNGRIFGRFFFPDMTEEKIDVVTVIGSEIVNWYYSESNVEINSAAQARNQQLFGEKTIHMLNSLKVGVVGCSGTGSPVIEQLKRLGIGEFVLVDPDYIDNVNLNRIIGSTKADAADKVAKVDVMMRGFEELGIGTKVTVFKEYVTDKKVVKALSDCDILVGCVDSAEGRHILELIAFHYLLPYFDTGVYLETDGAGGISAIHGSLHYIKPGGSTLLSRKAYTMEDVGSDSYKRVDPEGHSANEYFANDEATIPAVISVTTQIAATAVNDILARLHPYRHLDNKDIDTIRVSFCDVISFPEAHPQPCKNFERFVGKGDTKPLINYYGLS